MIPQSELHKGLKTAAAFIDPKLPGLHVVHFYFKTPDTFELVATDGHKLVTIDYSVTHGCAPGTRVSIPLEIVKDILTRFPEDGEGEVTLMYWEGKLLITNGVETRDVIGAPASNYPDYSVAVGAVAASAEPTALDPRLLVAILKDCAPLSTYKKPWTLAVELTRSGGEAPIRLRFRLRPELGTITALTAYLMPLDPKTVHI
jgi:hypothetical protein